jgi:hypothetical protein
MLAITGYEVAAIILAIGASVALFVVAVGWTISKTGKETEEQS